VSQTFLCVPGIFTFNNFVSNRFLDKNKGLLHRNFQILGKNLYRTKKILGTHKQEKYKKKFYHLEFDIYNKKNGK
jgi:hypothetical protein